MSGPLSGAVGLCEYQCPIKSASGEKSSNHDGLNKTVRNTTVSLSPTHPFLARVRVCATATALAEAFGLEETFVRNEWLSQSRSPNLAPEQSEDKSNTSCDYPTFPHCATSAENPNSAAHTQAHPQKFRFSPCNIQDSINAPEGLRNKNDHAHQHDVTSPTKTSAITKHLTLKAAADPNQTSSALVTQKDYDAKVARCRSLGLDPDRFAPLFGNLCQFDGSDTQFMPEVVRRLMLQSNTLSSVGTSVANHNGDDDSHPVGSSSMPPGSDLCLTSAKTCGLSQSQTHRDLILLCDGRAVRKKSTGLYRVAKSHHAIDVKSLHKSFYFEAMIVSDGGKGGICVGLCDQSHPLNCLLGGGQTHSIGLHSSGKIVQEGGKFFPFGNRSFRTGDRVGCVVYPKKSLSHRHSDKSVVLKVVFFINDSFHGCIPVQWASNVPLYAAVSLCNGGSTVAFLCCERDWRMDRGPQFESWYNSGSAFCQTGTLEKQSDGNRHRHRLWNH